ncbi:DUF721 domain-containing protein [Palleronia salina]|uniref:DUF721 domain-containing protein n=1 Tax=Palleronia salina TaxID=313368 RepID=UPI0009351306|nr:DUF721 domain-containing protein [Palleronia salina]
MATTPHRRPYRRSAQRASTLLEQQIRRVGESRGFAVSRLLTHWPEIAGPDIAAIARPVNVRYGRGSMGATLTVLTTGAQAPMLEMQKDKLRERVNACYGYNAISRIRITQTAPTGFSDGAVEFTPAPKQAPRQPTPQAVTAARASTSDVTDPGLRAALERLGSHVLDTSPTPKGPK